MNAEEKGEFATLRESNKELLRLLRDFSKLVYYDAQTGLFSFSNSRSVTQKLVNDAKALVARAEQENT